MISQAIAQYLAFRENTNVRQTVVVRADRCAAFWAEPFIVQLGSKAVVANRHTIRPIQFLGNLGIPRIGGDWEAAAPISESQSQTKEAQQTKGREYKGLDIHKIELLMLSE